MYGNQYNPFNSPYYGQQPINRPQPVPSYPVANPNCCLNYQVTSGCCNGTTII